MLRFNKVLLLAAIFFLLVLAGCIKQENSSNGGMVLDDLTLPEYLVERNPTRDYWPTDGWKRQSIVNSAGSVLFEDLSSQVTQDLPFVNSLIVINNGLMVYEGYFNGQRPEDLQNQQSVAKSITSLLVGIALDRGQIPSLDLTLGETLPEYFENSQDGISPEITLRDALMMRSGLEHDPLNLAGEFESQDAYNVSVETELQEPIINSLLTVPQAYDPGTTWQYKTGDTQLVSEMFQALVGQSLTDYGVENLFSPLGILDVDWREDASGVTVGGAYLWMRPTDMAKIGFLMLNAGFWDGRQIVSKEWIQSSITPQGSGLNSETEKIEEIEFYGYQWWLWGPGSFGLPHGGFQAAGYGGQSILVLPDIDTVIVATSNSMVSAVVSSEQQDALNNFFNQQIIAKLVK